MQPSLRLSYIAVLQLTALTLAPATAEYDYLSILHGLRLAEAVDHLVAEVNSQDFRTTQDVPRRDNQNQDAPNL
jgi:hypothetical protein